MKKPISKSKAKAKAWNAFSRYIRTKYADKGGMCICYTCGKIAPIKEIQCGHGISGRNNAVLFMEEVCRPQCVGDNVFGRGKQSIFTMKLIKEHGMAKYEELVDLSNTTIQYKTIDYVQIAEKYKEKLMDLAPSK